MSAALKFTSDRGQLLDFSVFANRVAGRGLFFVRVAWRNFDFGHGRLWRVVRYVNAVHGRVGGGVCVCAGGIIIARVAIFCATFVL